MPVERIDHHIADEMNAAFVDSFLPQIVVGEAVSREQKVADDIGAKPVDLLRHSEIARAKARFDMGDADAELLGGYGAGQSGIDVANDDDEVGLLAEANLLEGGHDLARLHGVAGGADLEVDVRAGKAKLPEKHAVHALVIMLPGVHEELGETLRVFAERGDERRHLHEIGPRPDDVEDLHVRCSVGAWRCPRRAFSGHRAFDDFQHPLRQSLALIALRRRKRICPDFLDERVVGGKARQRRAKRVGILRLEGQPGTLALEQSPPIRRERHARWECPSPSPRKFWRE